MSKWTANKWLHKANKMRPYVEKAVQSLDDVEAIKVKKLYPSWENLVSVGSIIAEPGFKFLYGKDLYECVNANPTFQADWVPGVGTESLYMRIDETHEGTLNDPIPYSGNMVLNEGLYYSQNGQTYICTRDTGAAVHNPLADLVGLYVEVA